MGNVWDRSGKMPGDRGGGWDWGAHGGRKGGGQWIPKDPKSPLFGFGLTIEMRGAREAIRKLERLGRRSRGATLRSIAAGAGVFRRGAKPASPVETGLLSRSWRALRVKSSNPENLAYRVSPKPRFVGFSYKHRGSDVRALSQAKVNKLRQQYGLSQDELREISGKQFRKMFAGGPNKDLRKRWPMKYAHLVELGHDIVVGKRRATWKGMKYQGGFGGSVVGHVEGRHFLKGMFRSQERNALRAIIARARKEFGSGGAR